MCHIGLMGEGWTKVVLNTEGVGMGWSRNGSEARLKMGGMRVGWNVN